MSRKTRCKPSSSVEFENENDESVLEKNIH